MYNKGGNTHTNIGNTIIMTIEISSALVHIFPPSRRRYRRQREVGMEFPEAESLNVKSLVFKPSRIIILP